MTMCGTIRSLKSTHSDVGSSAFGLHRKFFGFGFCRKRIYFFGLALYYVEMKAEYI